MRRTAPALLVAVALFAAGCFPYISPKGAMTSAPAEYLGPAEPSGADYAGAPLVGATVLPFRLWGLDFEEEILFELADHPVYGMIEVTKVRARGKDAWFALVSERTGLQHVVVGSDFAIEIASTFPAPVHDGRLRVIRLQSDTHLEYVTAFHLPNGEVLQATLTSKLVGEPPPQRNGNSMNHSADRVLAVLDLEEYNWAQPEVFIEGERAGVRILAPFLPFAWRLEQTAGGISWGGVELKPGSDRDALLMKIDDVSTVVPFREQRHGDELHLIGADTVIDHIYRFRSVGEGPDAPRELVSAEVKHGDVSVFDVSFNPPIPDLRWRPSRPFVSRMVAGSNGQPGYMIGTVTVRAEGDRTVVEVVPDHPFWACERPIRTVIQYGDESARLRSEITPELAAKGKGRDACFDQDREAGL